LRLSLAQLKQLSQIAEQAALKAGGLMSAVLNSDPDLKTIQINTKKSGSSVASTVVTEVDLKSEKVILEILSPTLKKFDLALLSEETTDDQSRFEKDFFWCVDPLDGTLAFTQGRPGFSVSIALVSKQGEPIIGVVYDPSTQTLFSSTKGAGVYKNGTTFAVAKLNQTENNQLTIITEPSLLEHSSFASIQCALSQSEISSAWCGVDLEQGGGAVINACKVLESNPAVYFKLPKASEGGGCSWDFAATSAIFKELGLTVTDTFGKMLPLNKQGNTFMNHCGVLYASDKLIAEIVQNTLSRAIR
jgi:myo-inositol-1(or 4)-monophosphatase